jgi:glycosyltransferase involved in cell wall biosynthesis
VAFWQTLKNLAPDVIYARLPNDFLWIIRLYAQQSGSKFIYAIASTAHCDPWTAYDYNRWFHAPLFALGLQSAHVITAQHEQQVSLLKPSLRDRTAQVPNLVRSFRDRPRSFDEACYDAVWVGLIRPEKQLGRFLDLASALPELRFAVVGGFEAGHELEGRIELERRMLSLPNLSVLGPQRSEGVQMLLTKSKVLVNTSVAEGFPNTMLEAWSSGVPVISLSVDPGGMIAKERMGRVSGAPAELIRDVLELATNRELNLQLGARGLEYVRRTHGWETVYASLIKALPFSKVTEPLIQPS